MPADQPESVTFRFKKDDHHHVSPVNAVWGGRSPRGDIVVHLCQETESVPDTVVHELTDQGQLGRELKRTPKTIDRVVFSTIVLAPQNAHSIGQWLIERAIEAGFRPLSNREEGGSRGRSETAH